MGMMVMNDQERLPAFGSGAQSDALVAGGHGSINLGSVVGAAARRMPTAGTAPRLAGRGGLNETWFFRDRAVFDQCRAVVLPALRQARHEQRRLRVLSAGCASGQEAYSLAMMFEREARQYADWQVEVIAIDRGEEVVDRARTGIYSQFDVQRGLGIEYLVDYFHPVGGDWRICQRVRSMVRFEAFDLLDDLSRFGQFDLVFCRNVLPGLNRGEAALVAANIVRAMPAGGLIYVGMGEVLDAAGRRVRLLDAERALYAVAEEAAAVAARQG